LRKRIIMLRAMPLWLPGSLSLPVDLEATCDRTCREQRIMAAEGVVIA
jgi:hypothetical protein